MLQSDIRGNFKGLKKRFIINDAFLSEEREERKKKIKASLEKVNGCAFRSIHRYGRHIDRNNCVKIGTNFSDNLIIYIQTIIWFPLFLFSRDSNPLLEPAIR